GKSNFLGEVLEALKNEGYTYNFFRYNNCIYCKDPYLNFHSHELEIEEVFRSYDAGNMPASAIVYTVRPATPGIKGLLLNDY
ncbi:MAG: hypothetical protein ABIN67_12525, partial [Ferruginibacter sp.]